jgi:large subunit ribosomal protein L9
MEVILKEDVAKLGFKFDRVKVKPGFARNYLIPQGLAIEATPSVTKQYEENLRQAQNRLAREKSVAEEIAAKIEGLVLKIETLVGKDGRIYGSITPLQLSNMLKEQGVDVDRKRISMNQDPRESGAYTADLNLHREVKAVLKYEVVDKDKAEKDAAAAAKAEQEAAERAAEKDEDA